VEHLDATPCELDALIFDFDGLIIDSERVEADCIIEVLAMWGGVEFRVPSGWEVVAEVVPVMGGIDIKTLAPPSGRTLIVRGLVLMAGMDIKNVRTA